MQSHRHPSRVGLLAAAVAIALAAGSIGYLVADGAPPDADQPGFAAPAGGTIGATPSATGSGLDRQPVTRQPLPAAEAAPLRRVHQAGDLLQPIAAPPPPSQQVHQIPRAAIPDEVYQRLRTQLAGAREIAAVNSIDPFERLPPIDAAADPGLRRPDGSRSAVLSGRERSLDPTAEQRARERAAQGDR